MSRQAAREGALKLLYARMLGGDGSYDDIVRLADEAAVPRDKDRAFASQLAEGVSEHADQLDYLIGELSSAWSPERISRVELCILRIAMFEILYVDEIPESVSINEAVELAKTYGGERSSAYVNGVLGGLSRRLREGKNL